MIWLRLRLIIQRFIARMITGYGEIHLRGEGEYVIVSVLIRGSEVDVIREWCCDFDNVRTISHWVTETGILREYLGRKPDPLSHLYDGGKH